MNKTLHTFKRIAINTGGGDARRGARSSVARRPAYFARPVTRIDLRCGGGARIG